MKDRLKSLVERAQAEVASAGEQSVLDELKWRYVGRKGELTAILREIGRLPADQRPEAGRLANEARVAIEQAISSRALDLESARGNHLGDRIDITLPGRRPELGLRHPVAAVAEEIESIFSAMGFSIAEGPEIEDEEHNFEALNFLRDHPARDMQDTFYITDGIVLRTHTSPVQIRYMRANAPTVPVRIIAPGPVYRRDDDVTHSPMFSQVEGLAIDSGITLGDLKGVLADFARRMFGSRVRTRFRPSYFPFTEPSNEIDISCTICGGDGCRICKGTGWLEILGAGMVHPQVLKNGGYDPDAVTGFAFGMGIERVAMLKHGIEDVRLLFDNDIRFLRQVGGVV